MKSRKGIVAFDPRVPRIPRRRRAPEIVKRPVTAKPKETTMKPKPFSHVDRAVAAATEDARNWPTPDGSLLVSRSEAALLQGLLVLLRARVLIDDEADAFYALIHFRRVFERELLDSYCQPAAEVATPAETTLTN